MRALLAGLLLLIIPPMALCADWRPFFAGPNDVHFFQDQAAINYLANGNVRAWEREVWKEPDPSLGGETGILRLVEFDCLQHRFAFRDIRPFQGTDESIALIAGMRGKYLDQWQEVSTGDLDVARYTTWCTMVQKR
jgi:hypothetical protein